MDIQNELISKSLDLGFKSYFGLMSSVNEECYHLYMADLQKWLREKHSIHIYIDTTPVFDKMQGSKYKATIEVVFQPFKWTTGHYYLGDTYEEALEAGLLATLKHYKF